ncbi:MAG TPA: hypothetical protein VHL59_13580 [Thermoanaerobaculia bacterium]|nr:hypothetical protein [Thermoanaerobaculia bacterium]
MLTLRQHPEYRTAGVVRKLIEASARAIDTMPPDAVELTALATEIADHLEPAAYPGDTIPRLRGAAWRERAYALFYTGAFAEAETALHASESHFSDCSVEEYEMARVGIVRALVERAMEKYVPAIESARTSARVFKTFEDETRSVSAQLAEVHLLFSCGKLDSAYATLMHLKAQLEHSGDNGTYARVLANLGYCCWRLGRSTEALTHHGAAAQLFEELGVYTDAVRERWNVARVLAHEGRVDDAIPRLRMLHIEFARLGMLASATQVNLDLAELLIERGAFSEVEEICRAAIAIFERSQLEQTSPALTALALMREAAGHRAATPALVRQVRDTIRRIPDQPKLLFAFPAE